MTRFVWAVLSFAMAGCATVSSETPVSVGEVHVRTGSEPSPAKPLADEEAKRYAEAVLPFARVASRAYCDYLRSVGAQSDVCDDDRPLAEADGWRSLFDSREGLRSEDQFTRLTFVAFYRVHLDDATKGDIVFGFRGTKYTFGSDWYANFRWLTRFLPGRDQYDVLYAYAPELIGRALSEAHAKAPGVREFDVYATGHSLGGGLAQLFAFSDRRVKAAVVFDPSPVTGYFTVVADARVNCNARVLRVYERGEILQYVRAMARRLYSPTENIAEVDFNVLHARGFAPVGNHSIVQFTNKLTQAVLALEAKTGAPVLGRVASRESLVERLPTSADAHCIATRQTGANALLPISNPGDAGSAVPR